MRSDLKRPYNVTDNPVDTSSADFIAVMAYLAKNGLPMPQVIKEEVTRPEQPPLPGVPGRWTNVLLVWPGVNRPDPLVCTAYSVLNSPSTMVVEYKIWMGVTGIIAIPPEYAPEPPAPPPTMPYVWGRRPHENEPGYVMKVIPMGFGNQIFWVKE